jgi:hypothetical protein
MKTETLKSIETASIDDLKKIIESLYRNKDVKALDINLSINVLERINEELDELLFEYLYGNDEVEFDEDDYEKISEKFFKSIDSKGLDFFEPYFNDLEKYNNFNRWEFCYYYEECYFIRWAEMDENKFFKDNLTEDIIKSK